MRAADFIICENPKHSLKLLNNLGIKKKLISLHDYNEEFVVQKLSKELKNKKIVLISDAGSPLISDPGFKLIKHCLNQNIRISSIPGPSSLIPALQLSGIPINQFCFMGFFPKNKNDMVDFVANIKDFNKTSVFFVSSHKLKNCLDLLEQEISDRQISISKELTKLNEKTFWGSSQQVKNKINEKKENLKGEFVAVVEGKTLKNTNSRSLEEYNIEIVKLLSKFSLTDVVEIVHKLTGIKKNKVYKWVLELKKL